MKSNSTSEHGQAGLKPQNTFCLGVSGWSLSQVREMLQALEGIVRSESLLIKRRL